MLECWNAGMPECWTKLKLEALHPSEFSIKKGMPKHPFIITRIDLT
ncbi:hypothetical protein SHVI106290_15210 [Shewanella violacea]